MAQNELRFGIELEMLAKSSRKKHEDWQSLADEIVAELTANGVNIHILDSWVDDAEVYQNWSIVDEISITPDIGKQRYGIELVSPVLELAKRKIWTKELHHIWSILHRHFKPSTSDDCGTHIHLSPIHGKWTLSQVRGLAKSIIYFERSIDSIMPSRRRTNIYCRTNRQNPYFKRLTMEEAFNKIDKAGSVSELISKLNLVSNAHAETDSKTVKGHVASVCRWNLTSITSSKGTIEFRQPPGSINESDSMLWIIFAVCFARQAVEEPHIDPSKKATLRLLLAHVTKGAELCQLHDIGPVKHLLQNSKDLPVDEIYDIANISPRELEKLKQRAKARNVSLEKYKACFGYK